MVPPPNGHVASGREFFQAYILPRMSPIAHNPSPVVTADAATGIEIRSLSKVFSQVGARAAAAVDGINLTIKPGELFFLLGPSGCGKTTLLRMIAGFIEPSGGSILFQTDGSSTDVASLAPEQRNTGMVFQSYALWPHMTVFENVAFGLDVRKIKGSERRNRVMEALDAVKMGEYSERKPNQLSGGQQQRIALARAVVIRPTVLLLDEPLSNLDAKLRIELRSEIRRLCKLFGMTTVYVTHDQKEALSMADRIAILRSGKVIQVGTPIELYRNPGSKFVAAFLGETNFITGKVVQTAGTRTKVQTPAGEIFAVSAIQHPEGSLVTLSIRPEAIILGTTAADQCFQGTVRHTTYLGESLQYDIELTGGMVVTSAIHNPPIDSAVQVGANTQVSFSIQDVVVLTE